MASRTSHKGFEYNPGFNDFRNSYEDAAVSGIIDSKSIVITGEEI
jgi:hypothetical protein